VHDHESRARHLFPDARVFSALRALNLVAAGRVFSFPNRPRPLFQFKDNTCTTIAIPTATSTTGHGTGSTAIVNDSVDDILRARGFAQQRAWWRTLDLSRVGLRDPRQTLTNYMDIYR
jgi:hypothetical protein